MTNLGHIYCIFVVQGTERDDWAARRVELCDISERNQASLRAVESATFVVCLDDVSDAGKTDGEVCCFAP